MKKILLAAMLIVGVVVSQFVTMSQAEAYQPQHGDVAIVYYWQCGNCNAIYKQVTIYGKYSDTNPPDYGCHDNSRHQWYVRTYDTYKFLNGQWMRM